MACAPCEQEHEGAKLAGAAPAFRSLPCPCALTAQAQVWHELAGAVGPLLLVQQLQEAGRANRRRHLLGTRRLCRGG